MRSLFVGDVHRRMLIYYPKLGLGRVFCFQSDCSLSDCVISSTLPK